MSDTLKQEITLCPACDSTNLESFSYRDVFMTIAHGVALKVEATYPVWHCLDCEMDFSDHVGEEARQVAVDKAVADYRATLPK